MIMIMLMIMKMMIIISVRTIIGDGDRKCAPFLVLGLAPWYGTFLLFLEQIAPSPAAHARTCCEDIWGCRAGKMASEIHEIFNAFGPQFNAFRSVGIWLKYFRHKFLQFEWSKTVSNLGMSRYSPVPELSFLPAPYRDWTRAGERRDQDNLHAHAQCAAIFFPKSGEKPYLEVPSRFGLWRNFLNNSVQATISGFRSVKNMSVNPKSVEFQQLHAKPHSICFLPQYRI